MWPVNQGAEKKKTGEGMTWQKRDRRRETVSGRPENERRMKQGEGWWNPRGREREKKGGREREEREREGEQEKERR